MNTKALRAQRAKLVADFRAIYDTAQGEQRPLNDAELASARAINDDIDKLKQQIDLAESAELRDRADAEERAIVPESQRETPADRRTDAPSAAQYNDAFDQYLRRGAGGMDPDARERVSQYSMRNQNTITGAAGGFLVPPDTSLYTKIVEAMKFFGGTRNMGATVLSTSTGADLSMPTDNDTANKGVIVAEEGDHSAGTALTIGQVTLGAYLYSSKIVKVSIQLLQDADFSIDSYLARKFGMRIGRITNTHFTTGSGTGQPRGYMTAASVGVTAAATTAVTFDEVIGLVHSVDIAYRANGAFSFHDNTALALRKLKDTTNQYLWQPGLQAGQPDRLLGYPVVINNDIATMAASARSIAFGDHSAYYIRDVLGVRVVRLDELYAANGQVGFMAFSRHDGDLIDAGTGPIKVLAQAAV